MIVGVGCTQAAGEIYSDYYEYKYIDPATGEFVDPDTFVPDIQSDISDSSEDITSSEDYTSSEETTSSETAVESKAVVINVSDYGAKGDGKTNDGKAIFDAVAALMQGGKGSKLVFEKNKKYYVSDNGGISTRALEFRLLKSATIEGNGSTILCDGEMNYLEINECTDLVINNLNFDRKTRSHFVGTVYNVNYEEGYFDVVADRDFGFTEEVYTPADTMFAFLNDEGKASRRYLYLDKLVTLDKNKRQYRYYADMEGGQNTAGQFKNVAVDKRVIIPTPYIGEVLPAALNIFNNNNLTMKNVNVWNIPFFGFHVNGNSGKVLFENVNIIPPEDETVVFSSWRDGFHCKHNSAQIIWKDCKAVGLGDDIINISNNMLYVSKIYKNSKDEKKSIVAVTYKETGGSYGKVEEGSKVHIYDVDSGKLLAKTTIERVYSEYENIYQLSDYIPGLKTGENIRFSIVSHAAPNSQLINCDFEGTLRFKGAGGLAKDCRLSLYCLFMYAETDVEGPIPHNITFSNCDFTGTWEGRLTITSNSPVAFWKEGYYRLENIKFENCKGLTRSLFSNDLNFNPASVDYITITPALAE